METIEEFVRVEYGSGSGSGSGDGRGYGDGDGYGRGYGRGYGDGYGDGYGHVYGDGSGSGYGDGIKSISGNNVYKIDGVNTVIYSVHGNMARGAILNTDMTLTPCYVAKEGRNFAHGDTARDALMSLNEKLYDGRNRNASPHSVSTFPTRNGDTLHPSCSCGITC